MLVHRFTRLYCMRLHHTIKRAHLRAARAEAEGDGLPGAEELGPCRPDVARRLPGVLRGRGQGCSVILSVTIIQEVSYYSMR